MVDPEGTRKLEPILAADVAGYSRLMQDDDEATVVTLEAYRAVFRESSLMSANSPLSLLFHFLTQFWHVTREIDPCVGVEQFGVRHTGLFEAHGEAFGAVRERHDQALLGI